MTTSRPMRSGRNRSRSNPLRLTSNLGRPKLGARRAPRGSRSLDLGIVIGIAAQLASPDFRFNRIIAVPEGAGTSSRPPPLGMFFTGFILW